MRYELAVEIARPPAEVYAFLADPSNLPLWQEEVEEVRGTTGKPLPAGTTFTEVRTFMGKRVESVLEITASEPGREFSLRSLSGPVSFSARHLLQPTDDGTLLRLVGEADPGKLLGLAGPLVRKVAERRAHTDFDRLKSRLEEA
ncbi:MAG TPA: SRPBCC family protein [Gaiella sp.]|jgi:carbon monoxide dehydrogenase subunit G|nr:SRPBCC family protein [Gaiella sp.]